MQIIQLYRYEREGGGVTVSPNEPDLPYTTLYRLIADEGKVLTKDGQSFTVCADVEDAEGWHEVQDETMNATEDDYIEALEDLGVAFDE
jgi:hypothetical protein